MGGESTTTWRQFVEDLDVRDLPRPDLAIRDMIDARSTAEVEAGHKAFLRKWRLKRRAVANSLEEAGEDSFAASA